MAVFNFLSLHMLIHTHTHTQDEDPFSSPENEPVHIGSAHLFLQSLTYKVSQCTSTHVHTHARMWQNTAATNLLSAIYSHTYRMLCIHYFTYICNMCISQYVCMFAYAHTIVIHIYVCIMYPSTHIHTLCVTLELSEYLCISACAEKVAHSCTFKCKSGHPVVLTFCVCMFGCTVCVSLCLQIEVQERLPLTNFKGTEVGQLTVEALPCLQDGSLLEDNEVFVEDPTELIGKPLHFLLNIKDATGLPSRFSKVCMYIYSTERYKGQC